ncbi:baseplate J/gp47 family protein [Acetobacter sp. UBA5411]|uniref:baseplate J/gp47 family protein n=1 Tax=Acetobacter sp. UBA5411 TaxID=1945905 RepID=UPI0025B93FF4|nr:baseplate J/gp47 family protein [Acetobacter sp. UBA5411]
MSTSNGTTSVPTATFTDAGFVAPAESDILTGALADLNSAMGGNLNTDISTPQGQIATSFTAALGDAYAQILAVLNGVDPSRASGRLQDAIGNIYFLSRKGATSTVVTVVCAGVPSVVIPEGTLIQDSAGYRYSADGAITIDETGKGTGTFTCTTSGAIACAANSVSTYQTISGLTSVSNPSAGVEGSDEEGRVAFEKRRSASVAMNSVNVLDAIASNVGEVDGVTSVYAVDNPTSAAATVGGVSIDAYGLFVCVNGGTDEDVALAILEKKPPGCPYVGTTSVTVTDPNRKYTTPPSYVVKFTRATATATYFNVTIRSGVDVPSTATASIQAAVLAAFDDDDNATIGGILYSSAYYTAVAAVGSWVTIIEITIGTAASPTGFVADFDIDQIPTLDASDITVTVS